MVEEDKNMNIGDVFVVNEQEFKVIGIIEKKQICIMFFSYILHKKGIAIIFL